MKVPAGPVRNFTIDDNQVFHEDNMLGSRIPPLALTFFDENGNESCAFCPPDEDSDDVEQESSDGLNLDEDSESTPAYWVKIVSRSETLRVDVMINNNGYIKESPIYTILKVFYA